MFSFLKGFNSAPKEEEPIMSPRVDEKRPLDKYDPRRENAGKGRAYVEDMDEDEAFVNQNDPENKFVDIEDFSNEQGLSAYWESFDYIEAEELADDFENRYILRDQVMALKKREKQLRREGKFVKKVDPEEEAYKEAMRKRSEFSPEEFKLMEESFRFKTLLDKQDKMNNKVRPTFSNGEALTDEQIQEQAEEYLFCKSKNAWKDYSDFELDLMKACASWNYFYREISKAQKHPLGADKNPLTNEEMDELAKEYREFKENDPLGFADLKVEIGHWFRNKFKWQEEEYKGKKQLVSLYRSNVDGKNILTKYIASKILPGMITEEVRDNFYSIRDVKNINPNFTIVVVDIKEPINIKKAVADRKFLRKHPEVKKQS